MAKFKLAGQKTAAVNSNLAFCLSKQALAKMLEDVNFKPKWKDKIRQVLLKRA